MIERFVAAGPRRRTKYGCGSYLATGHRYHFLNDSRSFATPPQQHRRLSVPMIDRDTPKTASDLQIGSLNQLAHALVA